MNPAFDALPEDLLLNIFSLCDVKTLLAISLTCRRFYICIDKDIFWKQKLRSLYSRLEVPIKVEPKTSYKSACLRFCAVFNEDHVEMWTDCSRCQSVFCAASCIQDCDEVIIFDFGSKTTWFKYASDSTGQLSMHPTVSSSQPESTTSNVRSICDGLDIYQSCPVCSKMFQTKTLSMSTSEQNDRANVLKTEHSSSKRLTSAFSRLAMRHFPSCFDSADISDDVVSLSEDLQCNSLVALSGTSNHHDSRALDSRSNLQAAPDVPSLGETEQTLSNDSVKCTSPTENVTNEVAINLEQDTASSCDPLESNNRRGCGNSVATYEFLIQHMLKRNPFFQAQLIPFVLCEPTNCSPEMKIHLLQFLFMEVKVPGVCYIPKPVATALYSGLDTCLVIDSGANNTVVSPVVDQTVISHCIQTKPLGGAFLTNLLKECTRVKGVDFEVDDANLDSSQVKRECYLAYCLEAETRKHRPPRILHVKGHRNGYLEYQPVPLGPELYLACEDMYLNMDLPNMVKQALQSLDGSTCKKLLSNILLTGGNCRLNGLSLRLTKDLQQVLPDYQTILRVIDPRLMTGRTDAVIGASYIRKWFDASWVTRQDYILNGAMGCLEKAFTNPVYCV